MNKNIEFINGFMKIGLAEREMASYFIDDAIVNIAKELSNAGAVAIITGFPIMDCNVGETDGPLGALSLGMALQKIGKKVIIVTDQYNIELMEDTIKKLEIELPILKMENLRLIDEYYSKKWLIHHSIKQVIFIERPGNAIDNNFYDMRSKNITPIVYPLDTFLEVARSLNIITIGIGDGGNEIGMGSIFKNNQALLNSKKCYSNTITDLLLVCGISNIGAYGIIKMLEHNYQKKLACSVSCIKAMLEYFVDAGGVDGVTKMQSYSVDGLPMETYLSLYRRLFD